MWEEFQKNLVVWKLDKPAREVLSNILFQKNLVVWKLQKFHELWKVTHKFQKNLVVWKLPEMPQRLSGEEWVSEELSSVETIFLSYRYPILYFSFQKNLVVWKQNKTIIKPKKEKEFQKNLVVWKLFSKHSLCPM